tara:strand:+ start:141 stop:473 length:333 start_codon:yes stop_codon:yes gene_type:complete
MEIFEEDDEIKQLMLRISRKEITLCETCDTFFDYVPNKFACDECNASKLLNTRLARERKRLREYRQRPEVKERLRKYYQRPEVKARRRKRYHEQGVSIISHHLKQLREEE